MVRVRGVRRVVVEGEEVGSRPSTGGKDMDQEIWHI